MVVHDIRRESATRHLEAGADWADSPREVAEASEIVFTSLPGPTEVEAVGLGEDGILEGMSEGKVYFDLSTSTPTLIRQIHAHAAARGIHVLDAPVSGGPRGAASRNLAIWVGGDKDVFDRCKPVLDSIGDKAYYVGPIGCGAIAKLVHNCTGYIVQAALAEVFTMGVKGGRGAPGPLAGRTQGRPWTPRDLRGPRRAPAPRQLRPPRLRPPPSPQGRGPGRGRRSRVRRPHAPRPAHPPGDDRGPKPRLGHTATPGSQCSSRKSEPA